MKTKKIIPTLILTFIVFLSFSQTKKYHRNVTNNSENEIAPFLSMDGNTLIYTRKRAMDDGWKTQISVKKNGLWQRPKTFEVLNELPKSRLLGSYSTNINATQVLFSSKRYGGIGSYDIWITKRSGSTWTKPQNIAMPINSKLEEINAIFSLDEKSIFFIRREIGEDNGVIYNSKKRSNVLWNAPTKINIKGKYFAIRIAADNQTMYLSKIVGEVTELYISRLENNTWSTPIQIPQFPSSSDKYFAINTLSNHITICEKQDETYDLFKLKINSEYHSTPVSVLSIKSEIPHNIIITDSEKKEIVNGTNIENYYLLNNDTYILSIQYKSSFPLINEINLNSKKYKNIVLNPKAEPLTKGNIYELAIYNTDSTTLESELLYSQLKAIQQLAKNNPLIKFDIVHYKNNLTNKKTEEKNYDAAIRDSTIDNKGIIATDSTDKTINVHPIIIKKNETSGILKKIKEIQSNFTTNVNFKIGRDQKILNKPQGLYVIVK